RDACRNTRTDGPDCPEAPALCAPISRSASILSQMLRRERRAQLFYHAPVGVLASRGVAGNSHALPRTNAVRHVQMQGRNHLGRVEAVMGAWIGPDPQRLF